ncbi:MAG: hypothetical protein JEZ06_17990 [Anaerolineaceae bacterium]|nr:hypothetical protein [Anaerolineaceae bacterium]
MQNLNTEKKIEGIQKIIHWTGVLFGFLAGVSFAFFSWGIDGYLLSRANAYLPWGKFFFGVVPAALIGALIGWLCIRFNKALLSVILWGITGWFFSWLASRIPFNGMKLILEWSQFKYLDQVDFTLLQGLQDRGVFLMVIITAIAIFAGVFFLSLVEESAKGGYFFRSLIPFLVWVGAFALMGLMVNSVISEPMRTPLLIVDDMIQFELGTMDPGLTSGGENQMQYSSLKKIRELITRPRNLIVSSYDGQLVVVKVLIDFDGILARCTVLNKQPGFCEEVEISP